MAALIEDTTLRNRTYVFDDREDAGRLLGKALNRYKGPQNIILAIPSGGIPVAIEIRRVLTISLDLMIVRKAQLPWTTEAGFGAVNLDGDVVLNDALIRSVGLTEKTIEEQINKTRDIIEKRNLLFRKRKNDPVVKDRTVIIVDDGLASGYTMRAAVKYVRKRGPKEIIIAVPTGSYRTITALVSEVESLYCLNVREGFPFAVADAYREWYDLADVDVIDLMEHLQS